MIKSRFILLVPFLLGACAIADSHTAKLAKTTLLGMSELNLESCLGVPDQHVSVGHTDILTYYGNSTFSTSLAVPIIGGIGMSFGGYCHATFRIDNDRVSRILYSGEKDATLARSAYCAPIVRTCLNYLSTHPPQKSAAEDKTAPERAAPASASS